jgi:hypothetical protein
MNVLSFSFKSKNKGLHSKSKKGYLMGKRKWTIGQTMNYKNKLPRKLKTVSYLNIVNDTLIFSVRS